MRSILSILVGVFVLSFVVESACGQPNDYCREYGEVPTQAVGPGNRIVPFVYGRIVLRGQALSATQPRITAVYSDSSQPNVRLVIGKSGNFCFRRSGRGGTLIVEVEGTEVARRSFSDLGNSHIREDIEILSPNRRTELEPGVVVVKPSRPENPKTIELYRKAAEAEAEKERSMAIRLVKVIVAIDPEDFIAWSKLGSLLVEEKQLSDAENAFTQALVHKADYAPALLNYGILKAVKGDHVRAIELFLAAVKANPSSALGFRLLGEAYLQNRQGGLGLEALDKALLIDPVGMAECHLLKARLYDLAGARNLAADEYKAFLTKVRDHPDKKKFEKYIKDNPE